MLRFQCIQIFLCLFTYQNLFYSIAKYHKVNDDVLSLRSYELPVGKDLLKYLKTIEFMTIYSSENVNKIDINYAFGIFLVNVNFKSILREKGDLPYIIKTKLKKIIRINDKNFKEFQKSTKYNTTYKTEEFQKVLKLLTNTSHWVDRLNNLVITNLKSYNFDELKDIYPSWKYYLQDVKNKEKWTPNPKLSDSCLVALFSSDVVKKGSQSWCSLRDSCYEMLTEGDNFGYALTHRLLLLLVADLGRGCSIFSPKQDRALKYKYCSMAYAEVEYIAMNKYEIADLMMESMCLCSMEGHAQFLRRNWLRHLLYFQKPIGCFGTKLNSPEVVNSFDGRKFGFNTKYQNALQEECNIHTTAVASGVFSVAIRYIIQEYY
ncbi:uncharacterized protein LOC124540452 [Vanessa cardui]|uniref:uncharacterized protein LOC124540452 n=1 Tax=Vanessa cardui TaxID=171605 RepID=UPI001F13E5A2|nr:uncharacterized protein LOC124540452 [Vanessa cardui]